MTVFEIWVGENAVQEEQGCGGKDEVVQASPQGAPETGSEQGREKDQQEEIEGDRAGQVELRLEG